MLRAETNKCLYSFLQENTIYLQLTERVGE